MIGAAGFRLKGSDRIPKLIGALYLVLAWIERSKQRAQFANIDPSMLHDLALSQADVDGECRKRFWQS